MNRWLRALGVALLLVGCTPTADTGGAGGSTASGSTACADGLKNGDETGVDCGGSCGPCGEGKTCAGPSECASGHCTDGVCCEASCDGACVACVASKTGATDGSCAPVKVDTDPDAECNATDPSTCGAVGSGCNGDKAAPACVRHPAGTTCATESCKDGKVTSARACDGKGLCAPGMSVDCAPAECAPDGAMCAVSCATNEDCVVGFECALATHTCKPLGNTGGACEAAKDCSSGNCVEGVCCNTACDGACDVCTKALGATVDGACAVATTGSVGAPECAPFVCDGTTAACPNACSVDAQCSSGNYCNGGACVPKKLDGASCATANQCKADHCADGVCCNAACDGSCDVCTGALGATKDGVCTAAAKGVAGSPTCAPFVCDGKAGLCPKTCALDGDCSATSHCVANVCQPKKANGGACAATKECLSGQCVDKVCCNTACTGNCMACSVKGLEGTCSLVPNNLDPRAECVGHCDGMGACAPPTWTVDAAPILAAKCGACHTLNGAGGTNFGSVYADALIAAKFMSCANMNVAQCSLLRIKNGSMPKGKNCTGDPVLDAANLDCLTAAEHVVIETWVMSGSPE